MQYLTRESRLVVKFWDFKSTSRLLRGLDLIFVGTERRTKTGRRCIAAGGSKGKKKCSLWLGSSDQGGFRVYK
jgi:hypothetical protein